ncbi:MAG: hypothetical protein V2J02_15285 [Pseudomonadales bacterium]|nr:hypothetical protein [Pseudomonadales bacterium]
MIEHGGELMILGKLALTFGILLGVPLREWLRVRRLLAARAAEEAAQAVVGTREGPRSTVATSPRARSEATSR